MNKTSKSIYQITLSALFLALSIIFAAISKYIIPILHLPNGGSISLVMVPLTLVSLILGPLYGLFVSLIFALINLTFDSGFAYNYMSLILDYFLAFSTSIICSLYRKKYFEKKVSSLFYSILSFSFLRFICHFFSGVLISWNNNVGELLPNFQLSNIIFSLTYNLSYLFPSFIISQICLISLSKPLFKLNDSIMMKTICPYKEDELHINDFQKFNLFENIYFLILIPLILASIIGCIPYNGDNFSLKMHYLGYISITITILFMIPLIRKIMLYYSNSRNNINNCNDNDNNTLKLDYLLLIFSILNIGISICSILSYFTYGYHVYH